MVKCKKNYCAVKYFAFLRPYHSTLLSVLNSTISYYYNFFERIKTMQVYIFRMFLISTRFSEKELNILYSHSPFFNSTLIIKRTLNAFILNA